MPQSSGKRAALSPPGSGLRPTKRQERTSSPEEGELDDADPPPSSRVLSRHSPSALGTPQPTSRYSVKVKLPFKTKVNTTADPGAGAALPNNSKGVSAHPISDYYSVPQERPVADTGAQVLKKADPRNTRQVLAGVGTATLILMTRRTVIAKFAMDTEIDYPLDLPRALPQETMAGLAGQKFAPGHAPGPLGVLHLVPGLRRGGRPTDYRLTAPPEAPHCHCSLVAAT